MPYSVPPVLATMLNLRTAWRVPGRRPGDLLYAASIVAAEAWLLFRIWTTAASWATVLSGKRRDGWAAQAAAESGRGSGRLIGKLLAGTAVTSIAASGLAYGGSPPRRGRCRRRSSRSDGGRWRCSRPSVSSPW